MKLEIISKNGEKHLIVGEYAEKIYDNASRIGIDVLSYIRRYTMLKNVKDVHVYGSLPPKVITEKSDIKGIKIYFRNYVVSGKEFIILRGNECNKIIEDSKNSGMTPEEYLRSNISPFLYVKMVEILWQ
ncbi:MAG: hypothetical protein ACP5UV_03240 [Thermoplasmata archaeon]